MDTLVGYLTLVKGVEYVIAILFILGFVVFWELLNYQGHKMVLRVTLLAALAPTIWILVASYALGRNDGSLPSDALKSFQQSGPDVTSAYLTDMPPVADLSAMHADMANSFACSTCHHHGTGTQPCSSCHEAPFSSQDMSKPGLKGAYHERCLGCHEETQGAPTQCNECHGTGIDAVSMPDQATGAPSVVHRVGAGTPCLACHGSGVAGAPAVPEGHASRTEDTCQLCHKAEAGNQ